MGNITRKRFISSCKYCYDHKVKCDRGTPCQNCLRLNQSKCVYNFQGFISQNVGKPKRQKQRDAKENVVIYPSNALFPYIGSMMKNVIVSSADKKGNRCLGFYDFIKNEKVTYERDSVYTLLPDNSDMLIKFSLFWQSVHPLVPILDETVVLPKFDSFMSNLEKYDVFTFESQEEHHEPKFLIILFAILFAATIQQELTTTIPEELDTHQIEKNKYYNGYRKLLVQMKFPRTPSLECVLASLIIFETGTFNFRDVSYDVCVLNKSLCSMGMHLDSSISEKTSERLTHKKHFLWYTVQKIETFATVWSGALPAFNFHTKIVDLPNSHEYDVAQNKYLNTIDPFTSCQNLVFEILPYFSDLIIFLNIEVKSEYYCSFDLDTFEKNIFRLCKQFKEVNDGIEKCDLVRYSMVTNRWLLANSRNLLYRLYFLYHVCQEDRVVRSRSIRVSANKKEVNEIKHKLDSADKRLYTDLLKLNKPYETKLVEIVILLLYESRIRLGFSDEVVNFKWSIKNCNPFQYLVILMKDIYNQPTRVYDFKDLDQSVRDLIEKDMFLVPGDLRVFLVEEVIDRLDHFKYFWPESSRVVYNFLVKLWGFQKDTKQQWGEPSAGENEPLLGEKDMCLLSNIFDYFPLEMEYSNIVDSYNISEFVVDF